MFIHIKNLRLRTIIGIYDWERKAPQDIILNITLEFDGTDAAQSDDIAQTVDYKTLNQDIITMVEQSAFQLIEALVEATLDVCMKDSRVMKATVECDKPGALRFTDSVSISSRRERHA